MAGLRDGWLDSRRNAWMEGWMSTWRGMSKWMIETWIAEREMCGRVGWGGERLRSIGTSGVERIKGTVLLFNARLL